MKQSVSHSLTKRNKMNTPSQPVLLFREKQEIGCNNENALKAGESSSPLKTKPRSRTEAVSHETIEAIATHTRNKCAAETSCISSNGNRDSTNTQNFVLEPITAWERANSRTTGMKKTRTAEAHHEIDKFTSITTSNGKSTNLKREDVTESKTAISSPSLFRNPKENIDIFAHKQRFKSNRKDDTNDFRGVIYQDVRTHSRPTMNEIQFIIDSDYFIDGKELERNVVIDHATNRSYVYTTDLETKWMLPEFLYLDVPNSTYAARACGQFVTDKLVTELKQMVKPGSKQPLAVLEGLVKNCNKSSYEVRNIFVPCLPSRNGYQQNAVSVQAITAKFRLRYARSGTSIHTMLCHNFMNGHRCSRGILVFIPSMEKASHADRFWGTLDDVKGIPDINECITNAKMDRWCTQIAKRHGTFRGRDPEQMGFVGGDHQSLEHHHYLTCDVRNLTSSRNDVKETSTKKGAKKAVKMASLKKKFGPKMKTTKSTSKREKDLRDSTNNELHF